MQAEIRTIRPATPADRKAVLDIARRQRKSDQLPSHLQNSIQRDKCLVALEEGRVVAFVLFNEGFLGLTFIDTLVVAPALRPRGIASALIAAVENGAATEKIFTSTNESNAAMQAVLEGMGFVRSGVIENLDEGDPELLYFKRRAK